MREQSTQTLPSRLLWYLSCRNKKDTLRRNCTYIFVAEYRFRRKRLSKTHVIARRALPAVAISCQLVPASVIIPCHCEPVRRLAWQSVPLSMFRLHPCCKRSTDCHGSSSLAMTWMFEKRRSQPAGDCHATSWLAMTRVVERRGNQPALAAKRGCLKIHEIPPKKID